MLVQHTNLNNSILGELYKSFNKINEEFIIRKPNCDCLHEKILIELIVIIFMFQNQVLGFIRGNTTHSLIGRSNMAENNLSDTPNPKAGGIPYQRASTKDSSCSCASASPSSPITRCSLKRASRSIALLSSV